MSTTIDVFQAIEQAKGTNEKKIILQANKHNVLLQKAFVLAQDPSIVFHVNKFNMPAASQTFNNDDKLRNFLDLLSNDLSTKKITGNAAKQAVVEHFKQMNLEEQKWCQRILLKNMRCGIQATTINKVWLNAIKFFKISLAETLKSEFIKGSGIKLLEKVNYPVRVEPKFDGLRLIVVKRAGFVTMYTRNGTIIDTLPKIKAAIESTHHDDFVLDGEAFATTWDESVSIMMSSKSHKDDSKIIYHVFDCLTFLEWDKQVCDRSYELRLHAAATIIKSIGQLDKIKPVPHIIAHSDIELLEFFQSCMNTLYEGVMIKTIDTPYEFDRSRNILKLKPSITFEGIIVGHYKGRRGSKQEEKFGGFYVKLSKDKEPTRLGGGFSDALKNEIQTIGAEHFVGKIVEFEAQPDPMTKDGLTKDGKARFPVFIRFRDVADVDPKILDLS